MELRKVLAALLLITHACGVLSQTDPACVTPSNKNGFCVSIERCRNIYNLLQTGKPTRLHLNYIKKAACLRSDAEQSICCRPEETVPRRIPTTTTSPSVTQRISRGREPSQGVKLNWNLLPVKICGTTTVDKIADANKTRPFDHPWMVVLRYQTKNGPADNCGGSLINNRYVLTAAHCVKTRSDFELVAVRLGEHDKNTATDCIIYANGEEHCAPEAYDVDIEEMIIHAKYNRPNIIRHDIALIRMAQEITFSDSVRPICLPVDEKVRETHVPKYTITGWGTTEKQTVSPDLLQAFISHVSIPECQQKMDENFLSVTLADPWQMCAKGANRTDACKGDSGGPLGATVAVKGDPKFVQFGIVSAGGHFCGMESVPGIYTRVPAYMNWIVANIRP